MRGRPTTRRSRARSASSWSGSTRSSRALELEPLALEPVEPLEEAPAAHSKASRERARNACCEVTDEYVVDAYGDGALLELAERNEHLVVLDADLASDCRVRAFELAYPERFLECGIAEQDMVSVAAGLARHGLLPVVNSFAAFLASRANEQIYNQASEGTKVVYALHYAGLIPAGPGKSHQSLRDISLLAALPGMTIVQPANAEQTEALLRWAVEEAEASVAIRLAIGPSPRRIELPDGGDSAPGRGAVLLTGADAVLLAYGPVMLHEALTAAEVLAEQGIGLGGRQHALAQPLSTGTGWSRRSGRREHVFVLEDHAPVGGLGDALRRELGDRPITVFGVEGWPACGTPQEALRFHGLDGPVAGRAYPVGRCDGATLDRAVRRPHVPAERLRLAHGHARQPPQVVAYGELLRRGADGPPDYGGDDVPYFQEYLAGRGGRTRMESVERLVYLRAVFRDRPGVRAAGFKLMYGQVRESPGVLQYLALRRVRAVHLVRANLLDAVISYEVAKKTGVFHPHRGEFVRGGRGLARRERSPPSGSSTWSGLSRGRACGSSASVFRGSRSPTRSSSAGGTRRSAGFCGFSGSTHASMRSTRRSFGR